MRKLLQIFCLTSLTTVAQTTINVANSDFETVSGEPSAPTDWTVNLGTLLDGDANSGTNGALLTSTGPNAKITTGATYTLTADLKTYLTVYVKPTVLDDRSLLKITDDGGSQLKAGGQVVWGSNDVGSWHKIMMNTSYVSNADIDVKLELRNPLSGDAIHYDDVELLQNPLSVNGDMETEFLSNNSMNSLTQVFTKTGMSTLAREQSIVHAGSNAIKCVTTQAASTLKQNPNYQHVREAAEKIYQGSIWVKLDASSPAADFYVELWVDDVLAGIGATINIDYASNSDWVEVTTPQFTTDAVGGGTVYARLVCNNDGADRAIFYVDDYEIDKQNVDILSVNGSALDSKFYEITKHGIGLIGTSGTIEILDVLGRTLVKKELNFGKSLNYYFDSSMVYIVRIVTANGIVSRRIVFD
ncbi:T9SS type A sorting domain-containing protein [Flavicella sp.]|uniref:T9SS type A sorting domain-containing protein n=1 Tax=Flavicella sp. TaxID=2957742 RepID=UPI00261AC73C|nr:T9SS type A sorting domain-containing protein [Flavicella sp.]MDG1805855.1 T9SS type A sorting domain-containing protein [Flavicella sp.]